MIWYQTPFIIWTNYEQESETIDALSSFYLGSYVLDCANLKLTPYDEFLLELSKEMPVIQFLGCKDGENQYYRWDNVYDTVYPFEKGLREYEMLVYNHSLDNNEMKKMYTIAD